ARRQPSGQGRRASAQQAPGQAGSDEVSRSRADAPVALVDPNLAMDPAGAESPPARGKRARRGRGADGGSASAEAGSGRKGRKASREASDTEAGGSGPGQARANGAGTADAARALREAPELDSAEGEINLDVAGPEDAAGLEDVVALEDAVGLADVDIAGPDEAELDVEAALDGVDLEDLGDLTEVEVDVGLEEDEDGADAAAEDLDEAVADGALPEAGTPAPGGPGEEPVAVA